jgi:protein-S-isoprenylcysteine O-methyltransferase
MTLDRWIEKLQFVSEWLGKIQNKLNFHDYQSYPQFATPQGLGRVALLAGSLGILWGIHGTLLILLSFTNVFNDNDYLSVRQSIMAWQWCFYVWAMCTFHLLEFFTTAIYNPTVTSGNSYLVNHSKAYTAAALMAATEFLIQCLFFSGSHQYRYAHHVFVVWRMGCRIGGMLLVFVSQMIRSWAMSTCGESFNHLIQTSKKENHVLITHGIYRYLRHPSYVGFYYWSIGTQLVLGNTISLLVFASASWMFFRRRIPYEEESLMQHFPNGVYAAYAKRTWVGIPFIPTHLEEYDEGGGEDSSDDDDVGDDVDDKEKEELQEETKKTS